MSARLNFQFFSGSSIRARKRLRCSSFERWSKKFDDAGSIDMEVLLQIHYRTIAIAPNLLLVAWRVRQPFAAENFRMHAGDQHLLVIGSVEYADPSAFRQIACGAP